MACIWFCQGVPVYKFGNPPVPSQNNDDDIFMRELLRLEGGSSNRIIPQMNVVVNFFILMILTFSLSLYQYKTNWTIQLEHTMAAAHTKAQ